MPDETRPPETATTTGTEPVYNYRLRLLNGEVIEVQSLYTWPVFWSVVKRDGYMISAHGYVPHHAIGSIMPIEGPPQATVLKLVHDTKLQGS